MRMGKPPAEGQHRGPPAPRPAVREEPDDVKFAAVKNAQERVARENEEKKKNFEVLLEELHRRSNKAIRLTEGLDRGVNELNGVVQNLKMRIDEPGSLRKKLDSMKNELKPKELLLKDLKERHAKGEAGAGDKVALVEGQIAELQKAMTGKPEEIARSWKEIRATKEEKIPGLIKKIKDARMELAMINAEIEAKEKGVRELFKEVEGSVDAARVGEVLGEAISARSAIALQLEKTDEEMGQLTPDIRKLEGGGQ